MAEMVSLSAVIGLIAGSAVLIAFSSLVLFLSAHLLLVSYEAERLEGAKFFAQEHIKIANNLSEKHNELDDTSKVLDEAVKRVLVKEGEIDVHIENLKLRRQGLKQSTGILTSATSEVDAQTNRLVFQQKEVNQEMEIWSKEIKKGSQATQEISQNVKTLGDSISSFEQIVNEAGKSQKEFSKAVSEFSMFVKSQPIVEPYADLDFEKRMEDSSALNDRCSTLIARLTSVGA